MVTNSTTSRLRIFMIGLAAGTVLGLLLAPRSGEETRKLLGRKAEDGRDFVKSKEIELRRRADDVVESAKKEARRKTEDLIGAGRAKVESLRKKGKRWASRAA